MRYLLDTNVISELRKPRADPKLLSWFVQNELATAISELVLAELWRGAHQHRSDNRKAELLVWIDSLEKSFDNRVLPVNREVLKVWGRVVGESNRKGVRLATFDSLIAATALQRDLIVVTRNVRDFPNEVPTFNPWE